MTKMHRYPLMAAAIARPWPVLPDVGSTIVPPGFSRPSRSAASIIGRPIRSFTLPPGLSISSFASTCGRTPRATECRRTSGVSPTASRKESRTSNARIPLVVPSPSPGPSLGPVARAGPASGTSYRRRFARPRRGSRYPPPRKRSRGVHMDEGAPRYDVLVVEDDEFLARLLAVELSTTGYDVRVANDGVEGLASAFERCPDLVLADVMMPNMDGFELVRRLRGDPRTEGTSIILVTARGLQADKLRGLTAGADDYIVK